MNAGKSFNARRLALQLEVSQPAIAKALPALEKRGLIHMAKDRESKRFSIQLNRENPLVLGMKRADNIWRIYESGLAEFLRESLPGCTIILFGSFARGDDTYDSDIDIAVIESKNVNLDVSEFEKKIMKEIKVNFYRSFKEMGAELRNNILGGILLSGWIEL
jgi:predicted nucleotidyltransferase